MRHQQTPAALTPLPRVSPHLPKAQVPMSDLQSCQSLPQRGHDKDGLQPPTALSQPWAPSSWAYLWAGGPAWPQPVPIPREVPSAWGCPGCPALPCPAREPPWIPELAAAALVVPRPSPRLHLFSRRGLCGVRRHFCMLWGALVPCLLHSREQEINILSHHLWPCLYFDASLTSPTASRRSGALGIGSIRNSAKPMLHTLVSVPGGLLWLLVMGEATERLKQQTPSPGGEGKEVDGHAEL